MRTLQCLAAAAMLVGVSAPLHGQELHGSIAFSQEDDGGYAWGIAWRFGSRFDATREAVRQCRREGGSDCAEAGWFRDACGALAIGDGNGWGTGWGATEDAAEREAMQHCRDNNEVCEIEAVRCSHSEQAGGHGSRQEEDTAAAAEEDTAAAAEEDTAAAAEEDAAPVPPEECKWWNVDTSYGGAAGPTAKAAMQQVRDHCWSEPRPDCSRIDEPVCVDPAPR